MNTSISMSILTPMRTGMYILTLIHTLMVSIITITGIYTLGRDCSEVLIQLSAIESAINSVSRVILKEHLSTCVIDAVKRDDIEAIEELNRAIDKFIK